MPHVCALFRAYARRSSAGSAPPTARRRLRAGVVPLRGGQGVSLLVPTMVVIAARAPALFRKIQYAFSGGGTKRKRDEPPHAAPQPASDMSPPLRVGINLFSKRPRTQGCLDDEVRPFSLPSLLSPPLSYTCLPPGSGRKLRCISSGSLCRESAAGTHASLSTRCRRSRPPRLRPSAPPTPRAANRGRRHRQPAPHRCMRRHLLDALAEGRRRVPRCGHRSRWAARRRAWRPPRPVRLCWPPRRRRCHPTTMFATAILVRSRSRWSACDG